MNHNHRPLVSVVVPVYNAEKFLPECINSLLNMDYPADKMEIIFVNNNSTDGSSFILKKYIDKIVILDEPKQGASAARNMGIKNARYDIIAFTDADCAADKGWLKNITASLLKEKSIGAVGGRILSKIPCNSVERYGERIHDCQKAIEFFKPPYLNTANMAVYKDLLLKIGMFNENFLRGQDVELSFRLSAMGCRFRYEPQAVVFHQNQKTLRGLFREGFVHGFWSTGIMIKQRPNIKKRISICIKRFFYLWKAVFLEKGAFFKLCAFVFNLGKVAGVFYGFVKAGPFKYRGF